MLKANITKEITFHCARHTYAYLLLKNGKVKIISKKYHLPNDTLFDEKRYFSQSDHKELLEIKGIKICRQAKAYWVEEFDKRKNPLGQEYYWLTGKLVNKDKGEDTDEWALNNGFISIVPVEFDLTAYFAIKDLNEWDFK